MGNGIPIYPHVSIAGQWRTCKDALGHMRAVADASAFLCLLVPIPNSGPLAAGHALAASAPPCARACGACIAIASAQCLELYTYTYIWMYMCAGLMCVEHMHVHMQG